MNSLYVGGFTLFAASGTAILNMAATDIVAVYFDKYKEKVYAGLITFLSVGLSIAPTLLEHLMKTMTYRYAMLLRSSVFILAIPIALIYRGPCCTSKEEEKGQAPSVCDGESNKGFESVETSDKKASQTGVEEEAAVGKKDGRTSDVVPLQNSNESLENDLRDSQEKDDNPKLSVVKSHLHVLKDPVFIAMMLYFLLGSFGESTFYAFAVEYPATVGILAVKEAALGATLTSVGLLVGCVFVWIVSHWDINRYALAISSLFLLGIALICAGLSNSLPTIYASYIAFGFVEGCFVNNFLAWIALEFEDFQHFTTRIGYVYCMIGIGSLIGPIVTGYFIKATAMKYAMYFLSAFPMLGSLMIVPVWINVKVKQCRSESITTNSKHHMDIHGIEIVGPIVR